MRNYSSIYGNNDIYAKSALDSSRGWLAGSSVFGEWMQLDLGYPREVAGAVIGCRRDYCSQYVSEYTVEYSLDGQLWGEVNGTFEGSNEEDIASIFPGLVTARYIKFVPQTWVGYMAMVADVLLSQGTTLNAFFSHSN
jgi:hypothetical protein